MVGARHACVKCIESIFSVNRDAMPRGNWNWFFTAKTKMFVFLVLRYNFIGAASPARVYSMRWQR